MEIHELIEKKEGLESALLTRMRQMIDDFEKDTGCTVEDMTAQFAVTPADFSSVRSYRMRLQDVTVKIEFEGVKVGG